MLYCGGRKEAPVTAERDDYNDGIRCALLEPRTHRELTAAVAMLYCGGRKEVPVTAERDDYNDGIRSPPNQSRIAVAPPDLIYHCYLFST